MDFFGKEILHGLPYTIRPVHHLLTLFTNHTFALNHGIYYNSELMSETFE